MSAFVKFENVKKVYQMGEVSIEALRDATFEIEKGEFAVIVGASGAGKSTFLKMIMREEVPTSGSIVIDGVELNSLKTSKIPYYRSNSCQKSARKRKDSGKEQGRNLFKGSGSLC